MALSFVALVTVLASISQAAAYMPSWLQPLQPAYRRAGPAQQPVSEFQRPDFCHTQECPPFEVIKTAPNYEVRQYTSGQKWVYTEVTGLLYSSAVSTGFKRLYQYTDGSNDKQIKVPMTTPVLTRIKPSGSTFERSNYTIAIWLPTEFQKDPPKPTDDKVALISPDDDKVAYVLQFGGFLVDDITVDTHAKKLKQALLEDRLEFDEDAYFTATYDSATTLTHRHNEVWFSGDKSDAPSK